MANYARLVGCPSVAAAQGPEREARLAAVWDQGFTPARAGGWGPALTSRYCVPLFWLAGFAGHDTIALPKAPGLCADSAAYRARLQSRKAKLMALVPASLQSPYATLLDQWIEYVRLSFANTLLLDATDIFSLTSLDKAAGVLEAALGTLAGDALETAKLKPLGAFLQIEPLSADADPFFAAAAWRTQIAGVANSGDVAWPPEPGPAEIEFAKAQTRLPKPVWPSGLT